jgi:phage terminase large subunit
MKEIELTFKSKNAKQIEAVSYWIDDTTEEILYGGGKGGGKSFLGASLICADALIYPETHYFIARKELIDLRKFTIPTIHEVFKNWGVKIDNYCKYNGQDNYFEFTNGSKIFLIACNDIPSDPLFERFGSMQMTRGWIEEGGEINENAKANLWLSIGRWKNKEYNLKKKLLITANPKKGWMKRDFIDLWKADLMPKSRKFVQSLATDNKYLPDDYVKTLSDEKDLVRRQRLFLGDWDYEEDKDSLVMSDALSDMSSNTVTKSGEMYMTVDVARMGDDSTVVALWDDLECFKIDRYNKQSLDVTKQKIKDLASQHHVPYSRILIDEDGIGGGLVDFMYGTNGFVANSSALPTANEIRLKATKINNSLIPKNNFANLKTQCGYKLAEYINERKISLRDVSVRDELIDDLSAMLRVKDIDSDGKLMLKSKADVKIDIGRSPDIGDTFLFRMWFELRKQATGDDPHREVVINLQRNQFIRNSNSFGDRTNK